MKKIYVLRASRTLIKKDFSDIGYPNKKGSAQLPFLFGCPSLRISKFGPSLDFIEFFQKKQSRITEIVAPLYQKGLSISDISEQTGIARTTVWSAIRKQEKKLRSAAPVSFDRWRTARGKQRARPPYGFCYFQGEVIKSPAEYPTLLLIESLWKQGTDITSIMKKLEVKKLRSRTGKPWSYNVIKSVIRRYSDGTIKNILNVQTETKTKRSRK